MHNTRIILLTEDGSHTVSVPAMNVTYHSTHGAIQESMLVFIKTGLQYFTEQNRDSQGETINIFEMGFGTGLNALLTLQHAIQVCQKIAYQTIEPYPLSSEEIASLNYTDLINKDLRQSFYAMHQCKWNETIELHPLFSFQKLKTELKQFQVTQKTHVIYFDAFDPNTQPELWTGGVFKKMFAMLYSNGALVTYCSKGTVRRAMQAAGFKVEKLAGPPGKREIVRAIKPHQP
jgi:tRNA U34 5-methylaminomethyl-2-thiouridine-forming methyltransferase MnmC